MTQQCYVTDCVILMSTSQRGSVEVTATGAPGQRKQRLVFSLSSKAEGLSVLLTSKDFGVRKKKTPKKQTERDTERETERDRETEAERVRKRQRQRERTLVCVHLLV